MRADGHVANLDASASDDELEAFFRDAAGAVLRLVTHVNPRNGSRIAFVEFETAEGRARRSSAPVASSARVRCEWGRPRRRSVSREPS